MVQSGLWTRPRPGQRLPGCVVHVPSSVLTVRTTGTYCQFLNVCS